MATFESSSLVADRALVNELETFAEAVKAKIFHRRQLIKGNNRSKIPASTEALAADAFSFIDSMAFVNMIENL